MRHGLKSYIPEWWPIRSIEIGSNLKIAVYRGTGFAGSYKIFGSSVSYVGEYWDGAIRSIIIFPKEQSAPLGVILSDTAPNTISGYEPTSVFFPLPENINDKEAVYPAFPSDIDQKAEYVIIQGDNVEAELFQGHNFEPTSNSLVLPPKANVCSYDAESEFNGHKFYSLNRCVQKDAASMKVRWIGPDMTSTNVRSAAQETSSGGFILEPAAEQPGSSQGQEISLEVDTDRQGMNYNSYPLPNADPNLCANDCANDPNCKAFTYVKPGVRGTNSDPECWLKNGVPNPVSQQCCISGVKI